MMIIKKEKDKGSDLPDMRWRIFCPWNLAARKFVMNLNFLWWFLPFIFFGRSICTTELQKISICNAFCLLPHNTSWSLCQTCCPWPRAWSPSSGGWRGPGRPAGRRWSWWPHVWWTSVWPEQAGANEQWASYALLISEAYVWVNDESVSVHCNQHDAGAAQEHGDALDDARNLADPVL